MTTDPTPSPTADRDPVPDISIVLPMFNEAPNVERILSDVVAELDALGRTAEVLCVDDGSSDETAALVERYAEADPRVSLVRFSRNFGKEAALAAGVDLARGRAVVFMDADLQHPVDLLSALVAKWEEGFDVVDAHKETAADRGQESMLYRMAAGTFYGLMGTHAKASLRGSSDYKLLDRQVVEAVRQLPERHRFFRGLVGWVGFRVARVPLQVRQRESGSSKWDVLTLVRYASRNLVSFTSTPLRVIAWTGMVMLCLAAVLGVQTFWNWWRGSAVTGFTTVILTVIALGGLILLSLGVIAVYLAQMYDEQKARPVYVVRRPRASGH